MPSLISSTLGLGLLAAAGRVPKGPCRRCRSRTGRRGDARKRLGWSDSSPSLASPSMVSMTAPSASAASTRQELTVLPLRKTVQAPHSPARAAFLRAGQADALAQEAQQRPVLFDLALVDLTVDGRHDLHHATSRKTLRTKTPTMCARYSLLQRRSLIGLIAPLRGGDHACRRLVRRRQPVDEQRGGRAGADAQAQQPVLVHRGDADDAEVVALDALEFAVGTAGGGGLGRDVDLFEDLVRAAARCASRP